MPEDYVYILTNRSGTVYSGVTNDLVRRVAQHRAKAVDSLTRHYNVTQLVYYESTMDVHTAIAREKQIKGLTRANKIVLIEAMNPSWRDLSLDWFDPTPPDPSLARHGQAGSG